MEDIEFIYIDDDNHDIEVLNNTLDAEMVEVY